MGAWPPCTPQSTSPRPWGARSHIGEVEVAVVSPGGLLLLVDVKAGSVAQDECGPVRRHGASDDPKDIGPRRRRIHSALLSRLKDAGPWRSSTTAARNPLSGGT
jgi:hypothetical protein